MHQSDTMEIMELKQMHDWKQVDVNKVEDAKSAGNPCSMQVTNDAMDTESMK